MFVKLGDSTQKIPRKKSEVTEFTIQSGSHQQVPTTTPEVHQPFLQIRL